MLGFLARRVGQTIPTLLFVSILIFGLQQLMPGDPALILAGEERGDEQVLAQIRAELNLDKPIVVQYALWMGGVLQGDLGFSWRIREPIAGVIAQKLPVTLQLALMAFVIALVIGIPLGILSAVRKDTPIDWVANALGLAGLSLPNFWLGIMMILLFSVHLGWLPPSGYVPLSEDWRQSIATTIMPAFVLGSGIAAVFMRHMRSAMLQAMGQDYVRTARAKGLPTWMVIGKHALKNVMVPIVTVVGISFGLLLSGSIVIETVYGMPGIGRLLANAIFGRDYPVIQGGLLLTGTLLVLLNLVVDILYAVIDPRVRYGG